MNSGSKKTNGELEAPGRPPTATSTRRTITEFLESKILGLTNTHRLLLREQGDLIRRKDEMPGDEFQKRLSALLDQISLEAYDILAITRSKRFLEQDLEEQLEQLPTKTARAHEPDRAFFERAYAQSLIPRVMGSSARKPLQFNRNDQKRFRDDVLRSYNAISGTQTYCCASGRWFPKAEVKVAHLVPKDMTADEVLYLFGAREDTSSDPKNGIPPHSAIETAMDAGILVVVPKEPLGSNSWKTVLVDKARRNLTAYEIGGERITPVYWREYENKELRFPSLF